MKTLSSFIVAAMAALPVLAAEAPEPPTPVNLLVGQKVTIMLDGNPTTGYLWEQAGDLPAGSAVSVNLSCEPEPGDMFLCGAPMPTRLTIAGVKPGKAEVHMVYRRPWEKGKAPACEQRFLVTVAPATR